MASSPFVQSVHIKKVRHLENIDIELSPNRMRHLILTGPNGSGKTSVLEAISSWVGPYPSRRSEVSVTLSPSGLNRSIEIGTEEAIPFVLSFFGAKRRSEMDSVSGPTRLHLPKVTPRDIKLAKSFIQFLVNKENDIYRAAYKTDHATVAAITAWKEAFVARLRSLFDEPRLELEYDGEKYDFSIRLPGREPFGLNQLSDGFSAAIDIVAELLLRMEAHAPGRYDLPGIVLIDEIETHLHVELQKQILPFLTDFFPNLQFIVTSHSPFVLTSLRDCVVFDLEKRKRWENLAQLSAQTVIERYFESNMYSAAGASYLQRYEELASLPSRIAEQEAEYQTLRKELGAVPFDDAPELAARVAQIAAMTKKPKDEPEA
jgi:predicted ATP-dependent endonuclease of OLD family